MGEVSVPLGRMAKSEEIARLVVFLASLEAKYITGSNYVMDGGGAPISLEPY